MAFQISLPIPIPAVPRKTDPLIKCIIDNKAERLRKLIRGRDINGLYPSEDWKDDVTPLSAAVLCRNEEICSYLLEESADPNKSSTSGRTPLHYAAFTTGVPLSIVKRLLAAKADPDGFQLFTPLQCAVDRDREDIVKALIEAGASPEMNYGVNPELDKKVEKIICRLSSQSQVFEKVHLFFSLSFAVRTKKEIEVFRIYKENLFQEHPFIHTILFEVYFGVIGPSADQYRQSAIKWLKDTKSAYRYIEGVIKRFPKIPQKHCPNALNCLYAALCVSESISALVFSDLVSILTKSLQHSGNAQGAIINQVILTILNVMMQKTSEQKLGLNLSVYEKLCKSLLPLTRPDYSSLIRVWTYGLFAYIYDIAPKLVALPSIPEMILNTAEIEMDEVMKKKLQKLDESLRHPAGSSAVDNLCEEAAALSTSRKKKKKKKKKKKIQQEVGSQEGEGKEEPFPDTVVSSIEESNSSVQPFTQPDETSIPRRWHQTVAGMLVYYILSGGQHPFGEDVDCEYNISRGRYSLEHLDDDVAKDLVEWMINENPNERPTVEQTLAHPFFWTDDRRVQYLKILGNEKEAENCRNADEELLNAIAKYSEGKSFSEWKTELPSELVQKLDGKKKAYPENTLGLLRFIRNLHEHYKADAVTINLMALFPDLFGSVYIFAKERGWHSRESVRMDINSAS
ncbi:uncharacterized protein [Sinocyclocheilus grahami]|uniref:uncharacterized protein n=1 Tax=Sinocyclocheilus grahami TaxID=75366 RepID=UPI0007AC9643|nr:PREDICTED: uncharacterized protein LOC107559927 [Sinocyclocheilus grahami]